MKFKEPIPNNLIPKSILIRELDHTTTVLQNGWERIDPHYVYYSPWDEEYSNKLNDILNREGNFIEEYYEHQFKAVKALIEDYNFDKELILKDLDVFWREEINYYLHYNKLSPRDKSEEARNKYHNNSPFYSPVNVPVNWQLPFPRLSNV